MTTKNKDDISPAAAFASHPHDAPHPAQAGTGPVAATHYPLPPEVQRELAFTDTPPEAKVDNSLPEPNLAEGPMLQQRNAEAGAGRQALSDYGAPFGDAPDSDDPSHHDGGGTESQYAAKRVLTSNPPATETIAKREETARIAAATKAVSDREAAVQKVFDDKAAALKKTQEDKKAADDKAAADKAAADKKAEEDKKAAEAKKG